MGSQFSLLTAVPKRYLFEKLICARSFHTAVQRPGSICAGSDTEAAEEVSSKKALIRKIHHHPPGPFLPAVHLVFPAFGMSRVALY